MEYCALIQFPSTYCGTEALIVFKFCFLPLSTSTSKYWAFYTYDNLLWQFHAGASDPNTISQINVFYQNKKQNNKQTNPEK